MIYSFPSVSLKVGRVEQNVFFQNFSLFPYISMFSAHFVAYLSSLLELPRRGRTAHGHQGRQSASSSFSSFLFLTGEGMEAKPQIKNWHILLQFRYLSFILEITLRVLGKLSLKCFQIAPANIKSVTSKQAVFTYSHLN